MSTQNPHSRLASFIAPPISAGSSAGAAAVPGTDSRSFAGLAYDAVSRPGEGHPTDFYEFITLDSRRLVAFLGETESGVSPVTLRTTVAAHFRGMAASGPDALVAAAMRLNCALSNAGSALVTLFCASIDLARPALRYVSAGHETGLLFHAGSQRVERLEPTGTVLGLTSRTVYRQRSTALGPGDTLVGFSSGIADAPDRTGRPWGEAGVMEAIEDHWDDPPEVLVSRVLDAAAQYGVSAGKRADRTVIAARFAGAARLQHEQRASAVTFAAA